MPTMSPELVHEESQHDIVLSNGFELARYDNSDAFQEHEVMRILRSQDDSSATFYRIHSDGSDSAYAFPAEWLLEQRAEARKAIDIAARLDVLLVPGAEPIEAPRRSVGDWEPEDGHLTELEKEIVALTALTKLSGQERVDTIDELIEEAWSQDLNKLNRDIQKHGSDLALRVDRPDIKFTTLARLGGFGMRQVDDQEYAEYSNLDIIIPAPYVRNKFGLYGPPAGQITDLYVKR